MNVLSLFDGISCGQVALERAGINIEKYYASEIDEYTMQITQKNFPNTIQVGNVEKIDGKQLENIGLLIGGSPCQGFSLAGKQLNFVDPRSRLFFEYVRILNEVKPKYFLLENVKMKKEYQDIISKYLGVEPIEINSSLVSAQNRKRLYWTNIPNIEQPKDKNILLKDVIENGVADRNKSYCIDANYYKGGNLKSYFEKNRRQLIFSKNYLQYDLTGKGHKSQDQRAYYLDGKHGTLPSSSCSSKVKVLLDREKINIRKLSPIECERLQTLPDNYTEGISNTQRYKAIGNGWTVDVISHILKHIQ